MTSVGKKTTTATSTTTTSESGKFMWKNSLNFHFFRFRLFEEHSELLGLFNKFRELKTKEQQASSEELAEHANKVMETLDEGIRSLDELDTFFEYLHQVGASHTRIAGFKAEYFWVSARFKNVFWILFFFLENFAFWFREM